MHLITRRSLIFQDLFMIRLTLVPLSLIVAMAVLGCSRPAVQEDPIRSVKLIRVDAQSLSTVAVYAADIRARSESRLGFRVGGKLIERPAEVGQRVARGQLLAVLDAQDFQSGAQAAEAQVSAARNQRDLAAADLRRFEALRYQGFISGAELERRQTTLRAAQAALDQAEAQARVQVNQATYTRLLADADGVVVAVEAEPGQVVSAGTPVVRLARQGPRDAVFHVPEDQVARVRVGLPASVVLWAASGGQTRWSGQVREVAASADPATRTYAVKVALNASASEPPPLGSTATVTLGAPKGAEASAQAMRLPTSALWQQGQGSAVWVFDPSAGVVRARTVQVAGLDGNLAVIAGGLQPGDEVVAAGVHVLTEGQAVVRYAGMASR
jgi:membrane fusion protein, multidrug efflux system